MKPKRHHFVDKGVIVKCMVFPVVKNECESWTMMKAECRRIDAFKLWCWRRHFRVPWTAKRSHQSFPKEINLEYSLEGLILKLWYFGCLMWRANTLEKTLILGNIESKRRRGEQRKRWLDSIMNSMDVTLSKSWAIMDDRGTWWARVHGVTNIETWPTTTTTEISYKCHHSFCNSDHCLGYFRISLSCILGKITLKWPMQPNSEIENLDYPFFHISPLPQIWTSTTIFFPFFFFLPCLGDGRLHGDWNGNFLPQC